MRILCLPALAILACAPQTTAADPALPAGFDEVRRGGLVAERYAAPPVRLLCWNIERGRKFDGIAASLAAMPADLILLQEVDRFARRSGNRDVARDLASRLGLEFTFAAEFVELAQRASGEDAMHGQATLARMPTGNARLIRFREQDPSWRPRPWLPNWAIFQPRRGGRIALVTEHPASHGLLAVYNLHLESRGPESLRLAQINEVLEDARRYPDPATVIIAGDLNTKSPDSPVLAAVRAAGYHAALGGEITTRRGQPLDWIFVRGPWTAGGGRVHTHIRYADHYPLTLALSPEP